MTKRIVQATVNGITVWRIYHNMELVRVFFTLAEAQAFYNQIK